jgi:hypothetical protein
MGKFEDLFGELPVCCKRLLDEHVLAAGKKRLCLLRVKRVRRADIDSIYLVACSELLERRECKLRSMCLCEGAGILFLAGIRCYVLRFRHLASASRKRSVIADLPIVAMRTLSMRSS